jgi:hypothetical protein
MRFHLSDFNLNLVCIVQNRLVKGLHFFSVHRDDDSLRWREDGVQYLRFGEWLLPDGEEIAEREILLDEGLNMDGSARVMGMNSYRAE